VLILKKRDSWKVLVKEELASFSSFGFQNLGEFPLVEGCFRNLKDAFFTIGPHFKPILISYFLRFKQSVIICKLFNYLFTSPPDER